MNTHRPSGWQRAAAVLASQLVASTLLVGVLLAFDPAIAAMLILPAWT